MFDVSDGLTRERRGLRPGGADTRAALLDAAGEEFVEHGYESATIRAIAGRANVDAAMVKHWFGSKEGLFAEAVIDVPFDLIGLVARLHDGDVGGLCERIVRSFLANCDAQVAVSSRRSYAAALAIRRPTTTCTTS
jgi:AcrR family transcriptional regulator